jgi:ornithine carbamoyltransferase
MRNLIDIKNLNQDDILEIFDYSKNLNNKFSDIHKNNNLGLIFEKSSTRTRLSFQVAINNLSGKYIDIKYDELNLSRIESIEDTFKMFNLYLDSIILRTSDHNKFKILKDNFKKPIINALSDKSHPCQAISDLYTLFEHFDRKENIEISWFGDCNNVLFSLIEIVNIFSNIKLNIFTDKNIYFNFSKTIYKSANIDFFFEIDETVIKSSDCIMTDVFNSMNDTTNKEKLLSKFQVNRKLMSLSKNECVFMHCLPAKIGSEVTQEVIDSDKSITLNQAKNRLTAQRGILQWLNI